MLLNCPHGRAKQAIRPSKKCPALTRLVLSPVRRTPYPCVITSCQFLPRQVLFLAGSGNWPWALLRCQVWKRGESNAPDSDEPRHALPVTVGFTDRPPTASPNAGHAPRLERGADLGDPLDLGFVVDLRGLEVADLFAILPDDAEELPASTP